ncbi:uncharacterized protein HKW66_Vig0168760 [Vigna angularis]|uniref:Uncharacterized protein n=1 Tax=Phaseolus angularis TaxID=3914 RepID=A0A8T0JS94_PHAAN|nr:uncharacterized protein HKW66_Vig0168760 [Vigna angularis]
MTVEGPPPPEESRSKVVDAAALAGPDIGRTAGRGIPPTPVVQAQPGLTGPVCGVGGPAPGMMQPQFSRPSQLNAPPYPGGPPVMCPPGQMLGQFAPPPMARVWTAPHETSSSGTDGERTFGSSAHLLHLAPACPHHLATVFRCLVLLDLACLLPQTLQTNNSNEIMDW